MTTSANTPATQRAAHKPGRAVRGLVLATPLVAVIAVVIYAAAGDNHGGSTVWSVLAVGLAAAGGAFAMGALLGFLFGLPKTVGGAASGSGLTTNTNLDQITDWLTKILVGLGLVQLGKVTHGVTKIANALAPGLGNGSGAKSFGVGLLVYAVVDGFLLCYLWTRIDLVELFRSADDSLRNAAKVLAAVAPILQVPLSEPPQERP